MSGLSRVGFGRNANNGGLGFTSASLRIAEVRVRPRGRRVWTSCIRARHATCARSASPGSDGLSLMTPFRGNAARSAAVQQIGAE